MKVELNGVNDYDNNECWAGNNWSNVSRLGSTSCEKDGGINKYMYIVLVIVYQIIMHQIMHTNVQIMEKIVNVMVT